MVACPKHAKIIFQKWHNSKYIDSLHLRLHSTEVTIVEMELLHLHLTEI